jgi:transposase
VDLQQLVFLDETGVKTNMTRLYARSKRGERAIEYAPCGHWATTTLVAAVTSDSAIAPMVLEGPMDSLAFEAYVKHVLAPALPANSIVAMDNLSSHKSPTLEKVLAEVGSSLRYLPPYSHDFNPIEPMWAKIKGSLRKAKARTQEDLYDAITKSLSEVTPQDIMGFFCHCCVGIIC